MDENGKAVKAAMVTPRSGEFSIFDHGESVETRENGEFAFDSLPDDVRFSISAPGYPFFPQAIALKLDGDEPVTVALDAPGLVRGRVIDTDTGNPVRQFRVQLGFSPQRQANDKPGTYNSSWRDPGITFNAADGKFLIKPLTSGMSMSLTVLAENYERAVIERAVAAEADKAEEVAVSLKPIDPSRRYTLHVQLLDHTGRPAPRAQLRLMVSTTKSTGPDDNNYNWALIDSGQLAQRTYCDQYLSGVTDADGQFEFKNILPEKHLQLAYWGEGVPRGRSFDFGQTRAGESDTIAIKLPQPARIRGTIRRERFANAASIRVSSTGAAFEEYERKLADDQASFEFDNLPPGEYWVAVASKPVEFTENGVQFFRISPLASQKVQLQPGETKQVSFTEPNEDVTSPKKPND